jgi:hypothetical protein
MQLADTPTVIRPPSLQVGREATFLTLGGERPTVQGVNLRGSVGSPSAGIILLARIQPSELSSALEQAPDPAIPIADFGNNNMVRRDFVGLNFDRESIHEIERTFAPIWRRLGEFPFKAAREGRAELTTLRLAYSRDSAITAVWIQIHVVLWSTHCLAQ